jgi:hypothetical protein
VDAVAVEQDAGGGHDSVTCTATASVEFDASCAIDALHALKYTIKFT